MLIYINREQKKFCFGLKYQGKYTLILKGNMKINSISPISLNKILLIQQDNKNSNKSLGNNSSNKYSYNPISYRDYGITFAARLFRTPANFFEQDFNRNGMPETMKNYLFDDYEDRQNMPPAQMMRLVFDDINETKSLEQVKRIYPKEPLFSNLRDIPNRNARTGVIAEIELMKQDDKSLFKNGQDNLGLYLLKKIYLEGKTLKEINKDFQKDISVYYKGLSPIKYETLSAYGIKFPNNAFWKSFVATREDFPYEYKPRKVIAPRNNVSNNIHKVEKTIVEKKKFDKVKDWEIDKLADAMIKGMGSQEETKKQIKRHNVQDKETLGFVAKYMSEINSVVLEKVHASDEMKDFFENYDTLSNSQREIFKAYWNSDPQIKTQRSIAMKDTIKLFMDAYGEDGNNDEFKDLLDYAHSIKPLRIERQREHDKIQAEYDKLFGQFEDVSDLPSNQVANQENLVNELKKNLEDSKNIKSYSISKSKREIHYNGDLTEDFKKELQSQMHLLPEAFHSRYLKYFISHPTVNDKYKLSVLIAGTIPEEYEDLVYSKEEVDKISLGVNKDFTLKYPNVITACNQALVELLSDLKPNEASKMLFLETDQLMKLASLAGLNELDRVQKAKLNQYYQDYLRPITSKEDINKINSMLVNFVANYSEKSSNECADISALIELLKANIKANPELKKDFTKLLRYSKFVEKYGGSAKILLKNNVSEDLKNAKMELMLGDMMSQYVIEMTDILSDNVYNLETILRPVSSEFYYLLKQKHDQRNY